MDKQRNNLGTDEKINKTWYNSTHSLPHNNENKKKTDYLRPSSGTMIITKKK